MDYSDFHFSSAALQPCGHLFSVDSIGASLARSSADMKICQLAPELLQDVPSPRQPFQCPECAGAITSLELDERATLHIPSGILFFDEVERVIDIPPSLATDWATASSENQHPAYPYLIFPEPLYTHVDLSDRIPFIQFDKE